MSWFFGKKKHKESPTESNDEDQPIDQGDEFIFVERKDHAAPQIPGDNSAVGYSSLYPNIGNLPMYPTPSIGNVSNQETENPHSLNRVPFKLCKQLEKSINNDMDIDFLRVSEIMSFIEKLESEDYNYNFQVEESVITEMDSRNDE